MSESLLPYTACSSTTIGGPRRQASLEASPCEHRQDPVTINTLPDDVLVEIFHFHVDRRGNWTKEWHTLVHVCQRWRHVVFASPCRLNLRLEYRGNRPMSDILDVWPVLPVVMIHNFYESSKYWRNFSAALESEQHHHRICEITLSHIPEYYCDRLAAAMQKPFPGLTSLQFWLEDNVAMSLPDSFLGGSAPLLRHLILRRCPFPGISKLLLSANQLVLLRLWDIPDSGYISPQDLGTALSVMSKLETLHLEFRSPPYPASRPPTPLTRSVLPALTRLEFEGVHEYLEDLLAQIEAPLLNNLIVVFFRNLDFVLPQLRRLISQAEWFKTCDRATVRAWPSDIHLRIYRGIHHFPFLSLRVLCEELDSQLASLAQVRNSTFPLLSTLVQLDIIDQDRYSARWKDVTKSQWVELLAPFTAVKDLRLSDHTARPICQALEELAEKRVTEVLPALNNIFLRGLRPSESVPKYIEGFVATRRLSGHSVVVHRWG